MVALALAKLFWPKCAGFTPGTLVRIAVGTVVGAGIVTLGIPAAVGALGFSAGGIAAGSAAAQMMSATAVASGGGVAAGSTVAVLQSIGAAGLSGAVKVAVTAGGAVLAAIFP